MGLEAVITHLEGSQIENSLLIIASSLDDQGSFI